MKVSILVPIYNVERYIGRCVESLMSQTYNDIEYIFVDDKTIDESMTVLRKITSAFMKSKQIKIIEHKKNKGLAGARITGLKNSTGDYVMFVDSDDFLEPEAVELMVKKINEDKSDVVISAFNHVFDSKTIFEDIPEYSSSEYLAHLLERKTALNVWARLYKRSLFFEHNVSFVEGINMGEDYVVTSRLFYYVKKISYIHKPLYNYIHVNTNSYTTSFKRKGMDEVLCAQKIIEDFFIAIGNTELLEKHYVGNLKLKAELLILLLRSANRNAEDFRFINSLFTEQKFKEKELISKLNTQDKVIIKLCKIMPIYIMTPIVVIGFRIKQIIK